MIRFEGEGGVWRERIFLTTMAPRGIVAAAVSAIFALRLEEENVADADKIVPIVFLIIIGTIVVYGFVAGPAARLLGLAEAQAHGVLIVGSHATARGLAAWEAQQARDSDAQRARYGLASQADLDALRAAGEQLPEGPARTAVMARVQQGQFDLQQAQRGAEE